MSEYVMSRMRLAGILFLGFAPRAGSKVRSRVEFGFGRSLQQILQFYHMTTFDVCQVQSR